MPDSERGRRVRRLMHEAGSSAGARRGIPLAALVALASALLATPAYAGFVKLGAFGSEGSGPSQFEGYSPFGIAVDQAPDAMSRVGDVYASDFNNRVEKFDSKGNYILQFGNSTLPVGDQFSYATGVAVDNACYGLTSLACTALGDPSVGDVYVRDWQGGRVEKFDSSGNFLAQVGGPGSGPGQFGSGFGDLTGSGLAVDSSGNLYVADAENHCVEKFDSSGTFKGEITAGLSKPTSVAVDPANNLYVADSGNVLKFNSLGNPAGSPYPITGISANGLATDPAGDLFVFAEGSHIVEYNSSGVEIEAFGSGAISETFHNGIAFGDEAGLLYAPNVSPSPAKEVVMFGPPPPPSIDGESFANVTPTTATLQAKINPNTLDTTYHFEYDTSEYRSGEVDSGGSPPHGTSVPISDADIGAGNTDQSVSQGISSLVRSTTYHFRVVATSTAGVTYGKDEHFTTATPLAPSIDVQSFTGVTLTAGTLTAEINPNWADTKCHFEYGTSASYGTSVPCAPGDLGEGNADQAASAAISGLTSGATYHFRVVATNAEGTSEGADETFTTLSPAGAFKLPDNRAYELVSPQEKAGYDVTVATIFRVADGSSVDGNVVAYPSYGAFPGSTGGGLTSMELASRGAQGWTSHSISPAMTCPCRADKHAFEYEWFTPDLSHAFAASTGAETSDSPRGYMNLYERDNGTNSYQLLTTETPPNADPLGYKPYFAGASADLSHVLLQANDALASGAPSGGVPDAYEVIDGTLSYIGILPGGALADGSLPGAGFEKENSGNVHNAISRDGSRVFFTAQQAGGAPYSKLYMRENNTNTIDVSAQASPSSTHFMTATPYGSKVFFTEGGDPYECEVIEAAGQLKCKLTDLAPGANVLPGSLAGAAEDGSYLYFAATGKLAPNAVSGEPNLYVLHNNGSAWEPPKLIATLDVNDGSDWQEAASLRSRVTPDGRYLIFESVRSLTGYDNTDAVTGKSDVELFRYDATAGTAGKLTCVSCNPSGSRPVGAADIRVPTTPLTPQRNISDDGQRVFFESNDALLPGDTNGRRDVYEWEADGKGSCHRPEGCVYLISTGHSDENSIFLLDASASGDDVFFTTRQQLVGQDQDNLVDLYDARVGGGFPYTPPSPPCAGEECRPRPSQAPLFGAPSTATLSGQGNLVVKPQEVTRAQKLSKALKACRKLKKKKRVACQKSARKKYAAKKASRAAHRGHAHGRRGR
jgi:hypothetical protein